MRRNRIDIYRRRLLALGALLGLPSGKAQDRRDADERAASAPLPPVAASAPTPVSPQGRSPAPAPAFPQSRGRVGARQFLTPYRQEPTGFGAYTYLLLAGIPSAAERPRHLQVLATLMRELPVLAEALHHSSPSGINLVTLPVRHLPQVPSLLEAVSDVGITRAAESLLAAYDHARAQALLTRLEVRPVNSGPVLVTLLKPAGEAAGGDRLLIEDMSTAAPAVAGAWMRFALRNSSQAQPWSAATLERTALKARNMIAQIARAVPDIDVRAQSWVVVAQLQR